MSEIEIRIRYFGAFRKYGTEMILSLEKGCSITKLKEAICTELKEGEHSLVFDSVLANDSDILDETDVLEADCQLSILPPVCGG